MVLLFSAACVLPLGSTQLPVLSLRGAKRRGNPYSYHAGSCGHLTQGSPVIGAGAMPGRRCCALRLRSALGKHALYASKYGSSIHSADYAETKTRIAANPQGRIPTSPAWYCCAPRLFSLRRVLLWWEQALMPGMALLWFAACVLPSGSTQPMPSPRDRGSPVETSARGRSADRAGRRDRGSPVETSAEGRSADRAGRRDRGSPGETSAEGRSADLHGRRDRCHRR